MNNFDRKYKNIFWFLIDGLRPDFLHLDRKDKKLNYIDKLLLKGTVFNNVITAGSGTHTSMHSIFTSLLPSYNGAAGWDKEALRNFNQEIFTISDYFQLAGYETFRYCDADGTRAVPMSGFKRWESGGYAIGRIIGHTDSGKTRRRDRFIEDVNICRKNKFVYHHIELLHELNGELEAGGVFGAAAITLKMLKKRQKNLKNYIRSIGSRTTISLFFLRIMA